MKQYKYRPTSRKPLMDNLHPRIEWFEDKFGNSDNYSFNHTHQIKSGVRKASVFDESRQDSYVVDKVELDRTGSTPAETLSGYEGIGAMCEEDLRRLG